MSEPLAFLMGKFAAILPADRRYCRNHMWCQPGAGGGYCFWFNAHPIRLLPDVYLLCWSLDSREPVALKQQMGNIETSKAVSDLFAPIGGTLTTINQDVLKDPSQINVDGYGQGWLFEMTGDAGGTLDAQAYHDFLAANWDQTQRILKGQMGE